MPHCTISSILGLSVVFGSISTLYLVLGLCVSIFFILGWGLLCIRKLQPTMDLKWDVVLVCGMGFWGLLTFGMLALGWWNFWIVGALLLLGGTGDTRSMAVPTVKATWFCVGCLVFDSLDVWGPMMIPMHCIITTLAKQMSLRSSLVEDGLNQWFSSNAAA